MSRKNEDLYDVSKYSNRELYQILDVSNPSDRELEAKILQLINKYENIQNETGEKLSQFFQDIYWHFFQDEDEEDEYEDERIQMIEGLETMSPGTSTPTPSSSSNQKSSEEKTEDKNSKVKTQLVTTADYVPDALRLNPLLKQTIKRIISVDSQYRDVKIYKNASSYAFDLSEPLRDVVSLKLYSVQIPYTWYVISKSYGANFFYLKGAVDGINNGLHDYQIQIKFGNYTNEELITEVNKAFADVSNNYPDVNFNNTGLTYDKAKSITTINIDIQKVYTEMYYRLRFPYWTTPVTTDQGRLASLPSYFGFNQDTYYPYAIHSLQDYQTTSFINNDTKRNFMFDSSNNFFRVIHYIGPQEYDPLFSTVIKTYTLTLYDDIYNSNQERLLPVLSSAGVPNYKYSRNEIISMTNKAIVRANAFTSDSGIKQIDISGNIEHTGNSYFQLDLKFDRKKVKYQPYSKMIVFFPEENAASYDNTTVWQLKENTTNSCFYFRNIKNEYGEFISETNILQSNYTVGSATHIYFRCINPPYMVATNDFSGNDFDIVIPQGTYTLNLFILQLNSEIQYAQSVNITKGVSFADLNPFTINAESKFNFKADMLKTFTESDYTISFDASSVLCKYMGFSPVTNGDLNTLNIFQGTFAIVFSGYILDTDYLFTIKPKQTSANKYEPHRIVNLNTPSLNFANYSQLLLAISNSIKQYSIINEDIVDTQTPYSQTTLTNVVNNMKTQVTVTLTIIIHYLLNEGNYQVEFLDDNYPIITNVNNTWYPFAIQEIYALYDYTLNPNPPPTFLSYASINGENVVSQNQINVTDTNNSIIIEPYYDASGGAYTPNNIITITIATGTYIIKQLIDEINHAFDANPVTYGSIANIETIDNDEYVKIRLNINKIYTSNDYNLVFYDPFSFVRCITGGQSVQNTTWDTTLGWILGFRSYTQYELLEENQNVNADFPEFPYYLASYTSVYKYNKIVNTNGLLTNTVINFSGDTTLTTTLYNYFVISLEDFNSSHINDGLVTVSRLDSSIEMPDYKSSSIKVCDPVTGKETEKPNTTIKNQLTQNQIYSLNQAVASRQTKTKTYSPGPFIKDLFGFVPIKSGTNGSYFIEYGGSLQLQERLFFGPVNIRKMSIQLMNDRGDLVDLNGSNWSFSFVVEQLYRSSNSGSAK